MKRAGPSLLHPLMRTDLLRGAASNARNKILSFRHIFGDPMMGESMVSHGAVMEI